MSTPLPPNEEELFSRASELPVAERAAYLDQACAGDAALRTRVEALLRADEAARSFMESPPASDLASALTQQTPRVAETAVGDRIGRYKLLQKLGEGGCGVVYMAEQEEPVRRRVALKVIKLGMDTKEVIARFEAERQALALMDHANIARVFDGGATDAGRPFFVMELVRGIPITKFCDEQNLPTAKRLELFMQACHAVQHAHQKGIIHRDLKPSNILVTLHDGVPMPKVIDFGIAKATHGRLTDNTLFTAFEQFIGTPAYMSPEQAELSGLDIDTRSDIYSLGVLLYELLTGRPPFDPKSLLSAGLDEIRRIIREVDPPRPSTRLSTLTDLERATIAKLRGILPAQLSTLLRGDLDWIVMRCLEKDRTRRYETANGLALDVLRHLHDEPVVARPSSTAYRFQKLVHRNKLAVGAAVAIAAALVIGLGMATWRYQREKSARAAEAAARGLAEQRRAEVESINRFLVSDMLGSANPEIAQGREITVKEVLDNAALRVPRTFAQNPLLEASIRKTIGETYLKLTLFDKAEPHLKAAWEIRRRLLGEDHPDSLIALRGFAALGALQAKFDETEKTLWDVHARQQRTGGANDPEALETLYQILEAKLARLDRISSRAVREPQIAEASALARTNHAKAVSLFGADDPRTLKHFQSVFIALMFAGIKAPTGQAALAQEAETVGAQVLAVQRRVLGEIHPDTMGTEVQYAKILGRVGKYAERDRMMVARLAVQHRVLGEDHETVGIAHRSMAITHLEIGRLQEAAESYKRFAAGVPKRHGWDSVRAHSFLHELGYVLVHCGQATDAEAFARERLPEAHRVGGPGCAGEIALKFILGAAVLAQGRAPEAEPLFRECLAYAHRQPNKPWSPESLLGAALLEQKKFAEAEPLLVTGFEDSARHRRETDGGLWWLSFTLWDTHARILRLYTEWKRPDKVAEWRQRESEITGRRTFRPSPTPLSQLPNKAPVNLAFDPPPSLQRASGVAGHQGWEVYGNNYDRFLAEAIPAAVAGAPALRLSSATAEPAHSVWLRQRFRADDFRGRRVRFRVEMKTEKLDAAQFAYAFLRLERQDGALIAESVRRSFGTSDWREHAIVFDVPTDARLIAFGTSLQGRGSVLLRAMRFEPVGTELPADNTLEHLGKPAAPRAIPESILNRPAPENLDFAAPPAPGVDAGTAPAGWTHTGGRLHAFQASLDRAQGRSQPVSLHVKSSSAEATAYSHMAQTFAAKDYREKRVRFSAWVKAQGTQRSPQIYMRLDSHAERGLVFDSSGARAPKGTGWHQHTIVLEVPTSADAISFGLSMFGAGEVWFNDVRFEVVGNEAPTTNRG